MVRIGECLACQYGDHKGHVKNYQAVPEGMLGGAMCPCTGECEGRGPRPSLLRRLGLGRLAPAKEGKEQT